MNEVIEAHQIVVLRRHVCCVPPGDTKKGRLLLNLFDHFSMFVQSLADRSSEVQLVAYVFQTNKAEPRQ